MRDIIDKYKRLLKEAKELTEMEDFAEILKWFNHKYDEVEDKGMGEQSRKTFWKLHFLLEDKMMELRNLRDDEPKKET